jgi:hypothetical protein
MAMSSQSPGARAAALGLVLPLLVAGLAAACTEADQSPTIAAAESDSSALEALVPAAGETDPPADVEAEAEAQAAPPGEPIPVVRPAADETVTIAPERDGIYSIEADPEQAAVGFEARNLVLRFPDGGRIVFARMLDLAEADDAPVLRVGDTDIDGDMILGQAMLQTAYYPPLVTGEVTEPLIAGLPPGDPAQAPAEDAGVEGMLEAAAPAAERELFYATDRQREGFSAADYRFTAHGAPEGLLSFGTLQVAEPPPGPQPTAPADWSAVELVPPGAATRALRVDPMWRSGFADRLGAEAGSEILVFAHGPGITFAQAASELAALAGARNFAGTLVLYSWPAEGGDSGNALIGRNLRAVLDTVRTQAPGAVIHLLVHPDLAVAVAPWLDPPTAAKARETAALYWRFGG